jgi:hypothetical protein
MPARFHARNNLLSVGGWFIQLNLRKISRAQSECPAHSGALAFRLLNSQPSDADIAIDGFERNLPSAFGKTATD